MSAAQLPVVATDDEETHTLENAHLRLGQLEFRQNTGKISTTLHVHCDCYMGNEEDEGLLLSVFGGDNEIAAIAAAVAAGSAFSLRYPGEDGEIGICVRMGENAANLRGTILIPGMKHPVRHLVVVSQTLRQNGIDGHTYLLNYFPDVAWALMASVMGLPARPEWGSWVIDQLDLQQRISPLVGFGCNPYSVHATRDELLQLLADGVQKQHLAFPEKNGPVHWPEFSVRDALQAVLHAPAAHSKAAAAVA
jgi:hypothetical protein